MPARARRRAQRLCGQRGEPGAVREANQSVRAGPPHAAPSLTCPAGRFGPVWPRCTADACGTDLLCRLARCDAADRPTAEAVGECRGLVCREGMCIGMEQRDEQPKRSLVRLERTNAKQNGMRENTNDRIFAYGSTIHCTVQGMSSQPEGLSCAIRAS